MQRTSADVGLTGLAVMGRNLALNLADSGHRVAVHNRTTARMEEFVAGPDGRPDVIGVRSPDELVAALTPPRRIIVMVRSGPAVDAVIDELAPRLETGDILVDGGNSHFADTIRRCRRLEAEGLRFVGAGISGGEEGARHGPSIMPGGTAAAWPEVGDLLRSIAATAPDGTPCCDWVGDDGAGHYVKMVHNGIEYGDMQLIAEAYSLLRADGRPHDEVADVFETWNRGPLESYLVEITAVILRAVDDETGEPLVERIVDAAGQKGTGRWTAASALDLGQPLTLVAEAVFARVVSSLREQRQRAADVLTGPSDAPGIAVEDLRDAMYASKIVSYAQGFQLLRAAADEHGWDLDLGRIAGLWRAGCIIRAGFLDGITAAFDRDGGLANLLLDPDFGEAVAGAQDGWRRVVAGAVTAGVPVPATASALAFFDGYRRRRLPANLIQAQRDLFGAHTYRRVDADPDVVFHTDWTGRGGTTSAGAYEA